MSILDCNTAVQKTLTTCGACERTMHEVARFTGKALGRESGLTHWIHEGDNYLCTLCDAERVGMLKNDPMVIGREEQELDAAIYESIKVASLLDQDCSEEDEDLRMAIEQSLNEC